MCGRYRRRRTDRRTIAEAFGIHEDDLADSFQEESDWEDSDCAPGSTQPVVYAGQEGEHLLAPMRWGFKLPDRLLFNTKSEGVLDSRFWQPRFDTRCIIPASSFFEWKHNPDRPGAKPGPKYEISLPNQPLFGLAGLWSNWQNPKTNQWERTFSIFTSEPNELMRTLHNRQPVILNPTEYAAWLAPSERPPVHLLRIFPAERLRAHPVEPVAAEPVSAQGSLF